MADMDKVQKAIISLLNGEGVFYASLIMQMRRIHAPDLPKGALMGVSVENGRIVLHVDPPRLEEHSIESVARILEHECLHLVLEHLTRKESKHHLVWNYATDLAANSLINGMDVGLIPGKAPFADFPAKKTSEFYYAKLKDKFEMHTITVNADGSVTIKDDKTGKEITVHPSGDHSGWKELDAGKDSLTREVIKQAVAEAYSHAKQQGRFPGGLQEIIEELLGKEKFNWKRVLKQYIGNAVKADSKYSWKRESKRFGDTQKGKVRNRTIDLAIAIDTSGSISTEEFQEFITEIKGIMSSYKTSVNVIECDAEVQKVYSLKKHAKVDTKFKGRGGTDFRPVFKWFEDKKKFPGLLVFFTDGEGAFPEKEPAKMKTLWVITSRSYVDKVPFGKLLKIPKDKGNND